MRAWLLMLAAAGCGGSDGEMDLAVADLSIADLTADLTTGDLAGFDGSGGCLQSQPRATLILADLVKRRILVKVSEHERGPGVEYGRGPAFVSVGSSRKKKR
jgi:hypothetical protein